MIKLGREEPAMSMDAGGERFPFLPLLLVMLFLLLLLPLLLSAQVR